MDAATVASYWKCSTDWDDFFVPPLPPIIYPTSVKLCHCVFALCSRRICSLLLLFLAHFLIYVRIWTTWPNLAQYNYIRHVSTHHSFSSRALQNHIVYIRGSQNKNLALEIYFFLERGHEIWPWIAWVSHSVRGTWQPCSTPDRNWQEFRQHCAA